MAVLVTYISQATVVETIDTSSPFVSSSDNTVTHDGLNTSATLNADSVVPVTKVAAFEKAMTSGAATIDLRSLTGTNGASIDGNGLKVQIAKFVNKVGNANDIQITYGASNPYLLLGTGFLLTLKPGQEQTLYLKDQAPDIGSSSKTIDISGTGAQVLQVELVMG